MALPAIAIYIATLVISTAVSYALAPKPEKPKPAELDDFQFPTAEEGRSIPVVFGTVRITGANVIWYGDLNSSAIKGGGTTLNGGLVGAVLGPIFSGFKKKKKKVQQQTVGYWYSMGMHIALCYGEVDAILKIEADDKEAWTGNITSSSTFTIDKPALFGGTSKEGGLKVTIDVCMGEPTQAKNSYLMSKIGNLIPAFRGICCLVIRGNVIANSTSIKPLAITVKNIISGWTVWYSAKADINGAMNPAHIVYRCLTDAEWGMGYPTSALDNTTFTDAANVLFDEELGLSLLWNKQSTIQAFIQEVCNHAGMALRTNPETGKFELKLLRKDYTIPSLKVFNESNISEIQQFQRSGYGEVINEVSIIYTDPDSKRETSITAHNLANIAAQGQIISQKNNYFGITNHTVAKRIAMRDLIASSTLLSKVKFTVNRKAWSLNGGDVFIFSWAKLGLANVVMRVGSIATGTLDNGLITVEAVEDVFGLPDSGYIEQQEGDIGSELNPSPSLYRKFIEASYFELESVFGDVFAKGIAQNVGYVSMACQASSTLNLDYEFRDRILGIGEFIKVDEAGHCPTAILTTDLAQEESSSVIVNGITGSFGAYGQTLYAIINNEYVRVDYLDTVSGQMTISRGVMDTVPQAHAAGSMVFFAEMHTAYDNLQAYTIGTQIEAKVLTRTNSGTLAEASAPTDSLTIQARHSKPYPPAKIRINGNYKPTHVAGVLSVSWEHRNRIYQSEVFEHPIDQTLTGIANEAGVTYTILFFNLSFTMSRSLTGLTGTSYTYPIHEEMADFGGYQSHLIAFIYSQRDGLNSWQSHNFIFERIYIAKDKDLTTPPASPATGDTYIVAASPTGAWSGHATHIAIWNGSTWDFYAPITDWRFYVYDELVYYRFNGSAWVIL